MISPLLFVACFMFIAILLLLGVIYSRVHWVLKSILLVVSLLFGVIFYRGYVGSLGYPAPIDAPPLFRFVYGFVHEPFLLKGDPGAIYVWMMTPGNDMPRVIVMPYSAATRKIIGDAKERVARGETVYMGLAGTGKSKSGGEGGSDGSGNNSAHKSPMTGPKSLPYDVHGDKTLEFEAPPDTLPRKDKS